MWGSDKDLPKQKTETERNRNRMFTGIVLVLLITKVAALKRSELTTYGQRCDAEQLESIEKADVIPHSNCPKRENWMSHVIKTSIKQDKATIISVGCNKADDFVALLGAWSGNLTYDVDLWVRGLSNLGSKEGSYDLHYACGRPQGRYPTSINSPRQISGYCIEPMPSTFKALSELSSSMNYDRSAVHFLNLAVDTFPGVALFPTGAAGREDFGLSDADRVPSVEVNVTNLDRFIAEHDLGIVDLLSIDTEGHDGRVIIGMLSSLARKKIRVFEFEYHSHGPWARIDLSQIADMIDILGYDCWWQGNGGELWRLTGCWLESHKLKQSWSNVVCVNRDDPGLHEYFVNYAELTHFL
jgi:FkbM family methyltransferase